MTFCALNSFENIEKGSFRQSKSTIPFQPVPYEVILHRCAWYENAGLDCHEMAMAAFESQYIDKDTYSASAVDIEVQSCFLDDSTD
ncbi:hypothetical protein Tco_0467855 [Tanacetum coccineum]